MAKKTCIICGKDHNRLRSEYCSKNCSTKKWHSQNKDKLNLNARRYYENNKSKVKKMVNKYYQDNKDSILEQKKEYFQLNKQRINKQFKLRKDVDINFKLTCILRVRLNTALNYGYKTGSAVKDLGCSIDEFKQYIESLWQDDMTWDNHNRKGWHIDHIMPLSSFDLNNPEELKKACHYTNLQPLWAKDNLSKGSKYE